MKPDLPLFVPAPFSKPRLGYRENGFSVVEAVVTLSILSLLAAVAVPQFSAYTKKLTLRSEASRLRLFLERCSAHALTSRETIEVAVSRNTFTASRQGGGVTSSHTLLHNTYIKPDNNDEITLLFHPTISASPATLILTNGTLTCSVIISLRTRIRFVC
jgi:Tfp pilus assembly protein FimT